MTAAELVLLAMAGLVAGSLFNVCISRIPKGESIVAPRSRCPGCRAPIAWYDNVPLVSYLVLGGRCRTCGMRIGLRYPLVEAATAALFVLQGTAWSGSPVDLGARLLFTSLLIILFGTDLETHRLPNVLTLPGLAAGVALSPWREVGLGDSLLGAALGAAILWVIRWGWHRATGVEGMGLGDVKMLAMIGAFLGWRQVWLVLLLSSLVGAAAGILAIAVRRRSMQARLPFGTFLSAAALVSSVAGAAIVDWYLGLYR